MAPFHDHHDGRDRPKDLSRNVTGDPLNTLPGRFALWISAMIVMLVGAPSAFSTQSNAPATKDPQNQTSETTSSVTEGDIVFFPGPLQSLDAEDAPASDGKLGWNIPDGNYQASDGWWALVCDTDEKIPDNMRGCRLSKTSLSVAPGKHPVYDDVPVTSQLLHWSPLPDRLDVGSPGENRRTQLIMVFKPTGAFANMKLNEGPVTTYLHNGLEHYPTTGSPGKFEIRIPTSNGSYADLVPRIRLSSLGYKNGALVDLRSGDHGEPNIDMLELREGAQHQRIPGGWSGCRLTYADMGGAISSPKEYLWWAGDLDGDGKLDIIVSWDDSADVTLYLSSLAKPGELVGFAGSFRFFDPSRGEC